MTEALDERYRFIRELGRGAMGSVRLVHDRVRGHAVAQKHLANGNAAASLHFKREYRVLSRLSHPNLVRVYELGDDRDGLYFVMEAVDGLPLDLHCRERGIYPSLEHILPQIVDALVFIHAHGVVHRDLKPSNVLITRDGVVKLLDFGVLGDFAGQRIAERMVVGTPGYMAPEQIRGEPPEPASDLYALGCMLFEVIAGRPVFEGTRLSILQAHLAQQPESLANVAPAVPPLYSGMVRELLEKDPLRRPHADQLRGLWLEAIDSSRSQRIKPPRILGELVGRDELLERLTEPLSRDEAAPAVLTLVGPSGIGKTAIVERFTRNLEREGRLVLRATVRPSERVAFNALDGAIDDLASTLALRDGDDPVVRGCAEIARRVFPVLATTGVRSSERCKELIRFRLFGATREYSRGDMFAALHRLMISAGGTKQRFVIAIDDFQWADQDSLALLSFLLGAAGGAPTVVVSMRDDVGTNAASEWLDARKDAERFQVPALELRDVGTIVAAAARGLGHEMGPSEIERAAVHCAGRPFLAEVAGRSLATRGTPDLEALVRREGDLERSLLGLLVAADAWTPRPLLANVTLASLGQLDDAIAILARDGLVRRGREAGIDGVVDLYHDGVRRAIAATIPEVVKHAHARLADHWMNVDDAPPERIVRHLLAAGQSAHAGRIARAAARRAEQQSAFGLAADMYEVALAHTDGERAELVEARAQALEKVGRHLDAASAWAELGRDGAPRRRPDFAICEAHALIAANEVDRGLNRLDWALVEAGDPRAHTRHPRELISAATFVLGPAGRHARSVLRLLGERRTRADVTSAERDVRIGILLSFLDPISGVRHLLRARDRFAAAGAREQEAHCDFMFAVLALVGSRRLDVPLAERYLRRAEHVLGPGPRSPVASALAEFVNGLGLLRRGRWTEARDSMDRAGLVFHRTGNVTERLMSASWSTMTDVYRQDAPAMRRQLAWFRQNLQELGGGIINAHVELLEGYLLQLEGEFEQSWKAVSRIVSMYSGRRSNVQRAGALLYRHMSDVYRNRGDAAHREFQTAMRQVASFRFFDTMYAGPFAMIGALLEAGALRRGSPDASSRRLEWFARRVESSPPLVAGSADRARAYAASDPERAIALLERAERVAREHDRRIDEAIAMFQRGRRLGGSLGAELVTRASARVKADGVSERVLDELTHSAGSSSSA